MVLSKLIIHKENLQVFTVVEMLEASGRKIKSADVRFDSCH